MLRTHPETVRCYNARVRAFLGHGPWVCVEGAPFMRGNGYMGVCSCWGEVVRGVEGDGTG